MKRKKFFRVATIVFGIFLLIDTATYILFANRAVPNVMVRFLPESSDEFCCVSKGTWIGLSAQQQRALDEELHKRFQTVYHGEDQIPESEKVYYLGGEELSESEREHSPSGMKPLGFKGIIFRWTAKARIPLMIRASPQNIADYCVLREERLLLSGCFTGGYMSLPTASGFRNVEPHRSKVRPAGPATWTRGKGVAQIVIDPGIRIDPVNARPACSDQLAIRASASGRDRQGRRSSREDTPRQ